MGTPPSFHLLAPFPRRHLHVRATAFFAEAGGRATEVVVRIVVIRLVIRGGVGAVTTGGAVAVAALPSSLGKAGEPLGAVLGVPRLSVVVVDEGQPEPGPVAVGPLEVVQDRPRWGG